MSEEWEFVETYCGCDIVRMWSPLYDQYLWTSDCDPHLRFSLAEERTYIRNAGFCTDPPLPPAEGKAEIISINLPAELYEGENVNGSATIKNVGDTVAPMRIHFTTEWDGKTYETAYEPGLSPGATLTGSWSGSTVKMPNHDAIITIKAQRKKDGVWITDDTKTH